MPKVSIGIVAYNNEDKIDKLLNSIYENVKSVDYKIYLVDNNSTDNTVKLVQEKYPTVNIIAMQENVGFGEGHNQVLSIIHSAYHVVVNPDIRIKTDVIGDLVAFMQSNPDVAMVSPKILNEDGTEQYVPKRRPKIKYLLSREFERFSDKFKTIREEYTMKNYPQDKPYEIEFATGCFQLIKTDVFKKIQGFDNRFFLYLEDADLTLRVKQYGKVMFVPNISVVHSWERASSKKIKYMLIHINSMIKFFWKWKNKK